MRLRAFRSFGELDGKDRHAALALHRNPAVVQIHDLFDDGKPDAVALLRVGFVRLIEFVEKLGESPAIYSLTEKGKNFIID